MPGAKCCHALSSLSRYPEADNQTAIDMLQPGDVLLVDIFGKKVNGTIVGDNLLYYVMKATNNGGLVVDGQDRAYGSRTPNPVFQFHLLLLSAHCNFVSDSGEEASLYRGAR